MGERPLPTVGEIAGRVGGRVEGDGTVGVAGATHDSRRVRTGDLFAAIPGCERDGHEFVAEAVVAGAAAVLVERPGPYPVPAILVADVRAALGTAAHAIWGNPSRLLAVAGITGTNGKTTTSFLTAAVLEALHGETAILGTLGFRRGEQKIETGFTTPEATDVARMFADLTADGVRALSMEVSSHALVLGRVAGIEFDAGAFTNLSPEHLDFHGTLEEYGQVKLGFLRRLAELDAVAAVNAEDPWADRFVEAGPRRTLRYALADSGADVHVERYAGDPAGTTLTVRTPAGAFETRLKLGGRFNAANALAAASIGVGLGLEPGRVGEALASVERVPGRYEIYRGGGVTVVLDYAHTPLAFERILRTVRDSGAKRMFCIFGSGGERDRLKRPLMARIAGELADVVYVTLDNPRREPIQQIMADTLAGLEGAAGRWERIDDRAAAIHRAVVEEAEPGDVVCLLGKGDEGYQLIENVKHPYSDREEARKALAEREAAS
ncbi:UDP-N-acetylmuramoyl-L-alanyl-D-glutamate--2,6-diaminopimelate ligase [soil metagenome]